MVQIPKADSLPGSWNLNQRVHCLEADSGKQQIPAVQILGIWKLVRPQIPPDSGSAGEILGENREGEGVGGDDGDAKGHYRYFISNSQLAIVTTKQLPAFPQQLFHSRFPTAAFQESTAQPNTP